MFQRFFEDFFGEQYSREYKQSGIGSGVIFDQRVYILTNEHVVSGADRILVRLADGREAKGTLTGTAPRSDLAVIKIDLPNLPFAKLGNSENLKIGQWVVAIGNPFGHILNNPEPTVTTGVISALHRTLPRTSRRDIDYSDLIQTDAAINTGNSGGPLVNLKGEIIGINVAIFSTYGGYQGIGFAIPINHATRIIDQLIKGEKVSYGWVGVSVQNIDRRLADYFSLSDSTGAIVMDVVDNSPADKSGVKNGDIILKINDQSIRDTAELIRLISELTVGSKAKLLVLRNNKKETLTVNVGKRPSFDEQGRMIFEEDLMPPQDEPLSDQPPVDVHNWRGLKVRDIDPQEFLAQPQLPQQGIGVLSVEPNSPAQETGLRPGDVITSINQQAIKNVTDYARVVSKLKGDCLIQTLRGYFVIKEK